MSNNDEEKKSHDFVKSTAASNYNSTNRSKNSIFKNIFISFTSAISFINTIISKKILANKKKA